MRVWVSLGAIEFRDMMHYLGPGCCEIELKNYS
jgi:hypothetical protein